MEKKLWVKILVVVLMVVVVVGIYIYKKAEEDQVMPQKTVQITLDNPEIEQAALEITSVDLEDLKSHNVPFVVDFGSDSCVPCKAMAPVLETLNEEWQGKARVHFVDVWKNTSAANAFPVSVIPTQIFYNADGTPFVPSAELAQGMDFTMYKSEDGSELIFTTHQGGVTEVEMRKIFAEMGVE